LDSSHLTSQQAAALVETLERQAKYFHRLVARMRQLHWPEDDKMYAQALRAKDATDALLETAIEQRRESETPAWQRARGA
jgi:hypothetical protein